MINRGANPHVRNHDHNSQDEMYSLGSLSKVTTVESIYLPIKPFPSGNLPKPFHYKTGVYPGKYGCVIGRGGEGIVVQGDWANEPCAFKFVEIKNQKLRKLVSDGLADMNARLRQMIEVETVSGDNILKLKGHHRY